MYIANLTIITPMGIFKAGEKVDGLAPSDVERMTAEGYITLKPDKKEPVAPVQPDAESPEKDAIEKEAKDGQQESRKKKRGGAK